MKKVYLPIVILVLILGFSFSALGQSEPPAPDTIPSWMDGKWIYNVYPYWYASGYGWFYQNQSDNPWVCDLQIDQWTEGKDVESGWIFFSYPYFYHAYHGHWFYWNRAAGTWFFNIEEGKWERIGYESVSAPSANINVDGDIGDWTGIDPALQGAPAEIYIAKDSSNLYIMSKLLTGTNPDNWTVYLYLGDDPVYWLDWDSVLMSTMFNQNSIFHMIPNGFEMIQTGIVSQGNNILESSIPLTDINIPAGGRFLWACVFEMSGTSFRWYYMDLYNYLRLQE